MKKGQITIFLIIGLFFLVSLFFLLKEDKIKEIQFIEESNLDISFKNCIETNLKESLIKFEKQGGYKDSPEDSFYYFQNDTITKIPYYYKEQKIKIPNLEVELEKLFLDIKEECKNTISQNYNIQNKGTEYFNFKIEEDYITLQYNPALIETIKDTEKELKEINLIIKTQIKNNFNKAKEITKVQSENGNSICLTCFENITIKEIIENTTASYIYKINNFYIAHQLELEQTNNQEKSIEIPDLNSTAGYLFTYKIEGEILPYTIDTDLFEIKNNLINFTPKEEDIGSHIITITQGKNEELFKLNINPILTKPRIDYIGYLTAKKEEFFSYQITSHGKNLKFIDNTEIFNITETGLIEFIPKELGEYKFEITAIGPSGESDTKEGTIRIE